MIGRDRIQNKSCAVKIITKKIIIKHINDYRITEQKIVNSVATEVCKYLLNL